MSKYDVVIVGAGVIGAAIAYELARYDLSVALVERNTRAAMETTEGNSAVIHGGFDPTPGKLNARLNLEGRHLFENDWFQTLAFPHKNVPSLVIAFSDEEMKHVHMLYERGLQNGLGPEEMKVLTQQECLQLEPHLNHEVVGALLCTTSHIVDPVALTNALLDNACANGVETIFNYDVTELRKDANGEFSITNAGSQFAPQPQRDLQARVIINAAGHYADELAAQLGYDDLTLTTRRGQYLVLPPSERQLVNNHILFMVPTIHGKGVIVAPTINNSVLVGPTAEEGVPKGDTRLITPATAAAIAEIGKRIIPSLPVTKISKMFSGSRPICSRSAVASEVDDFVIRPAVKDPNFINVAGIKSPGLSSAPAIAKMVVSLTGAVCALHKKKSVVAPARGALPQETD